MCYSTGYVASCWWSSSSNHILALLNRLCPRDTSFDQISGYFTSVVFSCTCQIITKLQLLLETSWWSLKGDHISSGSKLGFWRIQWCSLEALDCVVKKSRDLENRIWAFQVSSNKQSGFSTSSLLTIITTLPLLISIKSLTSIFDWQFNQDPE
jgi:hypothetical protein